jgi:hypothetical protein
MYEGFASSSCEYIKPQHESKDVWQGAEQMGGGLTGDKG